MGTIGEYLYLKLLHIFIAVVALGTSAGLGILLEFYGSDLKHGAFILRAIERMTALVVLPGYTLMLVTGLWMANLAWSFNATWIRIAFLLWVIGIVILGWSIAAVRKQRRLDPSEARDSSLYRRASLASRASGGAFGLVVVVILYLMVVKP